MFLSGLFRAAPATTLLDLDGLATLTVPASFHREPSPELELPVARRLLRRPYLDQLTPPDQTTYYLPSHDYHHLGGREIPALLRVTLYAEQAVLSEQPDATYLEYIQKTNFHSDEHDGYLLKQGRLAQPNLWVAQSEESVPGWLSVRRHTQQHLVLTDPARKVRLFLSASDQELPPPQAEQLLRRALRSLTRHPAALADYFAHAAQVGPRRAEARQANVAWNVDLFNEQLQVAGLPLLPPATASGSTGQFVDVGDFFYGLTAEPQLVFVTRLGTTARRPDPDAETFPGLTATVLNNLPAPERLPWPPLPAPATGEAHLHLLRGNSEGLWLPPTEVAASQPAALLQAAAGATAQLRGQPGFAPVSRTAPTYWDLAPGSRGQIAVAIGERADYRRGFLHFTPPGADFTLGYLGQCTTAAQPPQAVFRLTTPGTFTRLPTAMACAVDASHGGELPLAGAGLPYRARIEPLAQGHLTVEAG